MDRRALSRQRSPSEALTIPSPVHAKPVTHGVEAARGLVAGESLSDVVPLLGAELLVGVCYATVGLFLVRLFEVEARRGASLELA